MKLNFTFNSKEKIKINKGKYDREFSYDDGNNENGFVFC